MEEILIVDGYNIIHASPELSGLIDEELAHARLKLVSDIGQYKSMKGFSQAIIVFDAHLVREGSGSLFNEDGVEVVFTQEGQKADTLIERLVAKLSGEKRVYVATSDWQEQRTVLGYGAIRLSARELLDDLRYVREKSLQEHSCSGKHGERHLAWRLKGETLNILEKLRRKK